MACRFVVWDLMAFLIFSANIKPSPRKTRQKENETEKRKEGNVRSKTEETTDTNKQTIPHMLQAQHCLAIYSPYYSCSIIE